MSQLARSRDVSSPVNSNVSTSPRLVRQSATRNFSPPTSTSPRRTPLSPIPRASSPARSLLPGRMSPVINDRTAVRTSPRDNYQFSSGNSVTEMALASDPLADNDPDELNDADEVISDSSSPFNGSRTSPSRGRSNTVTLDALLEDEEAPVTNYNSPVEDAIENNNTPFRVPTALSPVSSGSPKVSPRSPRGFRTPPGTADNMMPNSLPTRKEVSEIPDLINRLLENGYVAIDTIYVEDNARYVKAINRRGQYVLIHINDPQFRRNSPSNFRAVESAMMIPLSLKKTAMECAGLEVCGVAFECADNICTIHRYSGDLSPKEIVLAPNYVDHTISLEGKEWSAIFPVVTMTDILAAPNLTLRNIDVVTKRIRQEMLVMFDEKLRNYLSLIEKLSQSAKTLDQQIRSGIHTLNVSSDKLERFWEKYEQIDPQSKIKQKDKHSAVVHNLAVRNQCYQLAYNTLGTVTGLRKEIGSLSDVNAKLAKYCESFLGGLEGIIPSDEWR